MKKRRTVDKIAQRLRDINRDLANLRRCRNPDQYPTRRLWLQLQLVTGFELLRGQPRIPLAPRIEELNP